MMPGDGMNSEVLKCNAIADVGCRDGGKYLNSTNIFMSSQSCSLDHNYFAKLFATENPVLVFKWF